MSGFFVVSHFVEFLGADYFCRLLSLIVSLGRRMSLFDACCCLLSRLGGGCLFLSLVVSLGRRLDLFDTCYLVFGRGQVFFAARPDNEMFEVQMNLSIIVSSSKFSQEFAIFQKKTLISIASNFTCFFSCN